jgi:hypothetical protein
MARCPVCGSVHIVIVVSPRPRASCSRCGARWIQEGSEQSAVHRLDTSSLNISAVSVHRSRPLNVLARRGTTRATGARDERETTNWCR